RLVAAKTATGTAGETSSDALCATSSETATRALATEMMKSRQSPMEPEADRGAYNSRPSTGAESAATLADSTCFNSVGERKKMRLFICHENGRNTMDVPEGKTVGAIKQIIKDRFKIRVDQVQLGDINFERNTLVLAYAGGELDDRWVLSDMGIKPGSTLRAYVKEETDPVLYLRLCYNEEMVPILDRLNLTGFPVSALRSMASRRSGLPVGIFRLATSQGVEMFDCHSLDEYSVKPGDTVRVETWDGWIDLLRLSALGFTSHLLEKISPTDEVLAKFQMKVALYMAAHFGQVELSTTLTRQHGVRADEAVGPHPLKQWCTAERHPDLKKTPIHEAVEMGQLSVLRGFVHHNVCSIMVRDGAGLQPLNLALRQKQKSCASFLLTKQWSRIGYGSGTVPLAIFARMKNWSEKAKDRVTVLYGQEKSSLKKKPIKGYPLVGQGVYVDGFSQQQLNSSNKPPANKQETEVTRAIDRYYSAMYRTDPEDHFKKVTKLMKTPKQKSKWAKMAGAGGNRGDQDAAAPMARIDSASTTPPQTQQQQQAPGGVKLPPLQQSSGSAVYIETGKQAAKKQPQKQLQQKSQATTSSLQLTKAKGNDGAIPLPLHSVEDTPRPFLHLRKGQTNEVQQVLDLYYRQRGVPAREYAIQCLSAAQSFKDKPWLHQVRLAMSFTETGVRKMTNKNSHNLFGTNQ
ncbi:hypothetical protein BOX15_Mlig021153g3, partial [Macrostomum lignano]